jgi:DNA-directed RNA polymerase specialized sigma24 family protein
MEDVTELISKLSRELGPDASDEEISKKVLEAIEALPESDRAQVLEQVVKGVSSGQLRHLDKEVEADRQADSGKGMPNSETAT